MQGKEGKGYGVLLHGMDCEVQTWNSAQQNSLPGPPPLPRPYTQASSAALAWLRSAPVGPSHDANAGERATPLPASSHQPRNVSACRCGEGVTACWAAQQPFAQQPCSQTSRI